jgi:hypothetical protein
MMTKVLKINQVFLWTVLSAAGSKNKEVLRTGYDLLHFRCSWKTGISSTR